MSTPVAFDSAILTPSSLNSEDLILSAEDREVLEQFRDVTMRGLSCPELKQTAVRIYSALRTHSERSQLHNALLENSFESLSLNPSNLFQALNLVDQKQEQVKQKKCDEKTSMYCVLHDFPSAELASSFLGVIAKKSHEVAKHILSGNSSPIEETSLNLGSGSLGVVNQVQVLGSLVAAKQLKQYESSREHEKLLSESKILVACTHENVIGLELVDEDLGIMYLELAENGTMANYLASKELDSKSLQSLLHQVASGCAHIHEKGYVHKDLKLDNVLITQNGTAKISDFGTSFHIDDFNPRKDSGSFLYLPPEAITARGTKEDCTKIDVWSYGMIIWELLKHDSFSTPFVFPEKNEGKVEPKHYESPFIFIMQVGRSFKGFSEKHLQETLDPKKLTKLDPTGKLYATMKACLEFDPKDRPSMAQIQEMLA
jgi:tRNA A-37 threonylcarbamoyl transferase component Bud32